MSTDQAVVAEACVLYPSSNLPYIKKFDVLFNYKQNLNTCEDSDFTDGVPFHEEYSNSSQKFKKPQNRHPKNSSADSRLRSAL